MDEVMNFHIHVEKLSKKISSRIGMIQRASKYLEIKYRKIIFNSMVLPYFDYCSHIWSNIDAKIKNIIIRLHKRGCKMILKVPKLTPTDDVLKELNWSSLQDRWNKNKMCFMYKVLQNDCPAYLQDYLLKWTSATTMAHDMHRAKLCTCQRYRVKVADEQWHIQEPKTGTHYQSDYENQRHMISSNQNFTNVHNYITYVLI